MDWFCVVEGNAADARGYINCRFLHQCHLWGQRGDISFVHRKNGQVSTLVSVNMQRVERVDRLLRQTWNHLNVAHSFRLTSQMCDSEWNFSVSKHLRFCTQNTSTVKTRCWTKCCSTQIGTPCPTATINGFLLKLALQFNCISSGRGFREEGWETDINTETKKGGEIVSLRRFYFSIIAVFK